MKVTEWVSYHDLIAGALLIILTIALVDFTLRGVNIPGTFWQAWIGLFIWLARGAISVPASFLVSLNTILQDKAKE